MFASEEEYNSVHYRLAQQQKVVGERWLSNIIILSPNRKVSGCDERILFILGIYLVSSILWDGLKPLGNSGYLWVPDILGDFW